MELRALYFVDCVEEKDPEIVFFLVHPLLLGMQGRIMILNLKRFKALGLLFLLQASVVLTSCGGPRMTPPEVIKGLYQILNDSHVIMERGNVQYWVDGGTLIGAVRHQGIVPWDDDLDVCLLPGQEEAFVNLAGDFKKLGYRVEKTSPFAYKVFPEGKDFPFLDVLTTVKKNGRIYYPTDALGSLKRRDGDQVFLDESEVLPLKKVKFGSFQVMIPNDPMPFLRSLYGESFMEVGYQSHVHSGGPVEPIRIQINEFTRRPAQPIDEVEDRTHLLN